MSGPASRPVSRVAVVTGGASGIGLGAARQLAADGHRVAVFDLNGAAAKTAAVELQGSIGVEADVADRASVDAAFARVRAELGPVEILVTSAGIESFDALADITADKWNRILAVNLTGTFNCAQVAVPDMVAAGWGRIVTISSSSAQSGTRRMSHYVASKGGVIAFTKALALDLAPHQITVNTIPPGVIDTPMMRRPIDAGTMNVDAVIARAPLGRLGTPEDIAVACVFLCSEEAGYITGQQINVNGGWYV